MRTVSVAVVHSTVSRCESGAVPGSQLFELPECTDSDVYIDFYPVAI